jgi:hypothetical protein
MGYSLGSGEVAQSIEGWFHKRLYYLGRHGEAAGEKADELRRELYLLIPSTG